MPLPLHHAVSFLTAVGIRRGMSFLEFIMKSFVRSDLAREKRIRY
jgi:hypothetical protein